MYRRIILRELIKRVEEPRRFIHVIFGPRQVGKTTMVTQLLDNFKENSSYASADNVAVSDTAWLQQIWENARLQYQLNARREYILVIDEVQKLENWSEIVKQQWDQDSRNDLNIKLILLGSSRLLLQKGLSESLAGRFETIYAGHWSYEEMQEAFGLSVDEYIYYGGYPGAISLREDEDRWRNYIMDSLIETTISKDILMLTRVDKPALLKQLFQIGCLYSGQILSYSKMMGQLQDAGNTTTLANYLQLLSDAGMLGGIEKFAGNVVRKRGSSPKFQVYNNALLSAQDTASYQEVRLDAKRWGRLAESCIGAHLINCSIAERYQIFYWREANDEVDFILQKGHKVVALEVKSGVKSANLGMSKFNDKFHPDKVLLVGTNGIPFEDFLKISPSILF